MAGNIVKWWKYKILGRYKPFPVLECPTDSEELMYHQVRAPSSCSAPPDLLLVSDRENNLPMKGNPVVNIISSTPSSNGGHSKNRNGKNANICQEQTLIDVTTGTEEGSGSASGAASAAKVPKGEEKKERMHLEEFTCDVSVEGGKSSQPLQFSFTFYDLDGHHGKITKDDIVGIVYTIYESIGKSVVVPHCGSKTINVRLTVSPEGKSKSAKLKKSEKPTHQSHQLQQQQPHAHPHPSQLGHSRRTHRIRPRKLIKSEDEDDESTSEKDIAATKKKLQSASAAKLKSADRVCCHQNGNGAAAVVQPHPHAHPHPHPVALGNANNCKYDNIYENMANLNCCGKKPEAAAVDPAECRECVQHKSELYLKQASSRVKMLRKARKQKYQENCHESRQRSLSVGNESCWNRKSTPHKSKPIAAVAANPSVVDNAARQKKTQSATDCWNNALKRNDLINIIRESMEKNRLCFQSNGKPQASVSPLRHRQRSNTVSNTASTASTHTQENHHHHQPHIPIYHQQMAINPAVLAVQNGNVHNKLNLCGYDSVLHAKICGGGAHHSPPSPLSLQHSHANTTITTVPTFQNSPKTHVNSKLQRATTSPHGHGYHRLASSPKLNPVALSTLNPALSAEEKFHQTINHVEKWLNERDASGKRLKDVKNFDNLLYAKLAEKLQESPAKSHNNKENIRRLHNQQLKLQRKQAASDCENLIHMTSDEDASTPTPKSSQTPPVDVMRCDSSNGNHSNSSSLIHRYVHEHIHHHYHHFENSED